MDEQEQMDIDRAMMMAKIGYQTQDISGVNTLLKELTDVEPHIIRVEQLLQGQGLDENGNIVTVCEPLCNKEGAANMGRMMRAMVSQVMLMSNLEEDQIRVMAEELGYDVVEDLTFNKVRYGIIYPRAMATITDIVTMSAMECGMSALNNGTRQMLRKSIMETTINTQGQGISGGKKGGGVLGLLGIGRK